MSQPPALWRRLRACCMALVLLTTPGCDGLLSPSNRQPKEARVVISGTSPTALRLITSTNFTAQQDAETGIYHVNFVRSDVVDQALPIDRTVRLNTDRFMARLVNTSIDQTATVVMQVFFDGSLVFSQEAALRDASLDFIHIFF
jgi:hypothetical protein